MKVGQQNLMVILTFPLNKGASNTFLQAEIQQLYDPDQIKQAFDQKNKLSKDDVKKTLASINLKEILLLFYQKHIQF